MGIDISTFYLNLSNRLDVWVGGGQMWLASDNYLMAKHSSSDQSRLNDIIFLMGGCLSHQLIRPLHLLQRSSVLKALTLKNSILREPIINRLHVHSLVCQVEEMLNVL